jgi:predicted transcriptional regulator/ribosome-associated translation inhibitor RaiA
MSGYTASQFISPFEDRPITTSDEPLLSILELTKSSHAPIYVIDNNTYKGIVSVFQTMNTTSNIPLSTKVSSQIINTPALTSDSTLHEVITAMISTKLYELPVLDKDAIVGVIHAKNVLRNIIKDTVILSFITECVDFKDPITYSSKGIVGDILPLMKNAGVSRILLTDSKGHLIGITSRSDIRALFSEPIDRQRYRGPAEDSRSTLFSDENKHSNDEPIEKFMKTNVFTLLDSTPKQQVISQLIQSKFNSVVLVDRVNKPTGFLSIKDILHCLGAVQSEVDIPIVFNKSNLNVSDDQITDSEQKIENMIKKLSKIRPIQKVEIAVDVQKYSNQKTSLYKTSMQVDFPGQNAVASSEDKIFMKSVKDTIRDIEKQFLKTTKRG